MHYSLFQLCRLAEESLAKRIILWIITPLSRFIMFHHIEHCPRCGFRYADILEEVKHQREELENAVKRQEELEFAREQNKFRNP